MLLVCMNPRPSLRQGGMCSLIGSFEILLSELTKLFFVCPNGTAGLLHL